MEHLDVNAAIWRILMSSTLQAAVHLGKDCSENLRSIKKQSMRSLKQLFHVTGKLITDQAPENLETMVKPPEVSTTNQTSQTDARVQGNLLRDYEQRFEDLPEHAQLTKLPSNAGLAKTVEKGQYFTTLDDDQLDRLKGSCREYTLPRSDQSSQVKGWIPGNEDWSSSGCDGLLSSRTLRC